MKHSSKRFFGILLGLVLLLALVLTFSLSVCAFADDVAYNVIIPDYIQYGGVAADKSSAKAGETVTLTARPDTDYNLLEIGAKAGRAETVADIIAAIGTASFTNGDDTDDTVDPVIVSKDSLTIGSCSIAAGENLTRWSDVFFAMDDEGNNWSFTLSGETGRITSIICRAGTFSGTSEYELIKPVVLTPDTTNPNVYTFSMPAAPVTVSAEFGKLYPLWVGGTQVTSANSSTNWEWSFDPDNATLELWSATITGDYHSAAIYAESMDLIINVNSDSTVTGPEDGYGIWVNSSDDVSRSITINGNGRLSVTGGSTCVKVSGSIIVNGTLSAATGTTGNDDKYGVDGNIVINQGAVVAVTGTTRAIRGTVTNAIAGLGWTDVSGDGGEEVIAVSEGRALNDYKKVQFPYYTVTFDTDNGEPENMPVLVAVGSTIAAPTTPTQVNMAFTGWFDGTNSVTFPYTPPGDVTLTAQWTDAVASITRNDKTSYYATLQDAFDMAEDDDIVRMISDVMMREHLFVRNKRITLDLNDHGLFINYSCIGYKILWVEDSGSLTLTDSAENKTAHIIEMDMSGEMNLPADQPLFRGRFPATGNGNKTIEVSGGYIAGGYASGGSGGGGVRVKSGSSFTMTGGTICACTTSMTYTGLGDSGGGVYVDADCSFTMTGGTIRDNNSYGNGGGVYVAGTFTMTGGTIRNNNSYGNGGGVHVNGGGSFTMTGGTISGNTAPAGGGVDVYGGMFTMNGDNAAISGNTATNFGGGVCLEDVSGSKFILINGAVSGNTAGSFGGGVFIWPNGTLEMSGGEIGGATEVGQNTAAAGGGVTVWGGTLTMSGGTISGNTATSGSGGGVDVNGGTFTMDGENAAISGNTATNFGGGVCLEDVSGSKFILINGAVSGNTAGSFGGGVFIWSKGTLEMSGGEISDNIATSLHGGGVTVWDGGALQMTGGSITGNSAPNWGGGVYVNGNSTLQVSGKAFVTGNLQGEAENNVYLDTGKIVTVSGALEDIARIGVTMQTPGVFTSGWASYMGTADPAENFTSENAGYNVYRDASGEARLSVPYAVTVDQAIEHGSVTVSPERQDGMYGEGETVTLLATPSDGYAFNSYTVTDADGQAVEVAEDNTFTMPAANVTVSAKFVPVYTVTFETDGGTPLPEAQLVESGKNATYPDTVPTRDGSSFEGWYLNDAPFRFSSTPITGNITLTAKWKANQYTIIWVDDDGTYLSMTTAAHGETPTHAAPAKHTDERFTYEFKAWDPVPQAATESAIYHATYTTTERVFTITVDNADTNGSITAPESGRYQDAIALTVTPNENYGIESVTYYDGSSHNVAPDESGAYSFPMPAANVTVSAKFGPVYTVSFDVEDGTPVPEAQRVTSGKYAAAPDTVPTKDGSRFEGWYLNDAPFLFNTTPIEGNITLTAKWQANEFSIVWVDDDDTYLATTTVSYGEIPTFAPPARLPDAQSAYAFNAWDPAPQPATETAVYKATYTPVAFFGTPTFTLPASTKSVGESAFEGLPMTIVEIPDGCTSIGANAFKDCANLTQIRIPASVTSIDTAAFEGCANVFVYGTAGSAAQTFCADHANCAFVAEN